jgi:hypothetical protein
MIRIAPVLLALSLASVVSPAGAADTADLEPVDLELVLLADTTGSLPGA